MNQKIIEKYFRNNPLYVFDEISIHTECENGWKAEEITMITLYKEGIIVGSFISRYYYGRDYPYELTTESEIQHLLRSIVSINDIYKEGYRHIG